MTKIVKPSHVDIQIALTALNNVCVANGVSLAGFIWDSGVTLYNFGCTAARDIETYEKLCRLAESRRKSGDVIKCEPLRSN
jgi:hypothetical protein